MEKGIRVLQIASCGKGSILQTAKAQGYLQTGQITCHDMLGRAVPCPGSGQEGEFRTGIAWPEPRFEERGELVFDRLTGLTWTGDANPAGFPLTWQEALDRVARMNREQALGHADWRLPNRRELRSLMSHQTRRPALPEGHPFTNVFSGWYWTSTTAAINTAYAWYVHTEGARMFYGNKEQFFLLWPVHGEGNGVLPATGQSVCYDARGLPVPCQGTGQDGELRTGMPWPTPRFEIFRDRVIDRLTNLCWLRTADLTCRPVTWSDALAAVAGLNEPSGERWRLPNINELESLVDSSSHSPALPAGHSFREVREGYWSSTTSLFAPDWAWALYLTKGAVGVGQKKGAHFHVCAVTEARVPGREDRRSLK